jgi:branched-chain amino acid transport system ATP-binding protein
MTTSTSPPPLLSVHDVCLSFAGVHALSHVSFELQERQILAIIGPNGAGKSSLLNVINGLYRADRGVVRFDGIQHRHLPVQDAAARGIARTFQNLALFKGMTVLENVLTGRVLKTRAGLLAHALSLPSARREEAAQRAQVERILELLGIQSVRDSLVGKLPYGLQKRVELGRALAAEPKLLLLDEPMAGMNQSEKQDMSRFIADANEQLGTTVILIEHDIGVVMELSDRIVVLDYGRKIADDLPELVRRDPAVIGAYLGVAHSSAA